MTRANLTQIHKWILLIIQKHSGNTRYSEDLKSELVWYSNGPKQLARRMVRYSSHDLNSEIIVG